MSLTSFILLCLAALFAWATWDDYDNGQPIDLPFPILGVCSLLGSVLFWSHAI